MAKYIDQSVAIARLTHRLDVTDFHLPKGWDQVLLHRCQICAGVGVGLDVGLFVGFEAGQCPRGEFFVADHADTLYHQLHFVIALEFFSLFLRVPKAFCAVK